MSASITAAGSRSWRPASATLIGKFHLLKLALAAVLAFVGAKMLLLDVFEIPIVASLGVIAGLIAAGVVGSLLFPRKLTLNDA